MWKIIEESKLRENSNDLTCITVEISSSRHNKVVKIWLEGVRRK